MGVYRKYRDKNGKTTGPWFVKYPSGRDLHGKISNSRKFEEQFLREKQDEFFKRDIQGLEIQDPNLINFHELMDWYLELPHVKGKKSYTNDFQSAEVLKERFGSLKADKITKTQVRNYRLQRRIKKAWRGDFVAPATVNREIALMRSAYNPALDEGIVRKNLSRKIKMFKKKSRDRILSLGSSSSFAANRVLMRDVL